MKEKCKSFEELTSAAAKFLKIKLLRSDATIRHYHIIWRKAKRYMEEKQIKYFDRSIGKNFLLEEFGNRDYSLLSKREKEIIRGINVLCEFASTGEIQPVKEPTEFKGSIGRLMLGYIAQKVSLRLKKHTIEEYERQLHRFLRYLQENRVSSIKAITPVLLLNYIKGLDSRHPSLAHLTIRTLRGFFNYVYEQQQIGIDLAGIIPKSNYKKQAKLPSVYTAQEIQEMIDGINRGTALGKRNYAIVLLASRLGLRASDIANLKFENLLWDQSTIVLRQFKTGKKIELPIIHEVGNAIIEYLKYGRPKSDEKFVFLLARSPYTPIQSGAITGIVHSCLLKAGINIGSRKHGAHVLRHSLAGILLERETILPVISEVLGHESTASTKYYLRIDLKSMGQCALDVPMVPSSFYNQRGGYFYE